MHHHALIEQQQEQWIALGTGLEMSSGKFR